MTRTVRPAARSQRRERGEARATPGADWMWLAAGGLMMLALLWTCRGFPLGVPVADDYSFLARLVFRPLDLFDSMGATYYWRPLSRQLYFSALGGALVEAPWRSALVHAAVLLATYVALWRITRRGFSAPVATALAVFPLLSEPARALLAWPSGAQHLLAGMFAAVALHEALAARVILALIAAGLGMLCHESAVLALGAIPAIAWWQARRSSALPSGTGAIDDTTSPAPRGRHSGAAAMRLNARIATFGALAVVALWAWGYLTARAHGVALPPRAVGALPIKLPALIARAIPAALNLEDLAPIPRTTLAIGYVFVGAFALIRIIGHPARVRLPIAAAVLAAGLGWFVLGTLPLATLSDWNAWRAWLPALGLGLGFGAALAFVHPALAIGFAGLRLVALLLASPGPATVSIIPPPTASHMSYVRLVRLQRTVESTRRALEAGNPELPSTAAVKFSNLPQLTEVGFQDAAALRVWYRDSTMTWSPLGGTSRLGQHVDALVEYLDDTAAPAQVIERAAFEPFFRASLAMSAGRTAEAEAAFDSAGRATRTRGQLYSLTAFNLSWLAIAKRDVIRADSLLNVSSQFGLKADADYWALVASIALVSNDREAAISANERCLALDPRHVSGLDIAQYLEATEERGSPTPQQTR